MDQLNVKEQQEFQQIVEQKQMKDFMRLYSNLVSKCFEDCVNDFTSANLTTKETTCISKCSEKFLKHSERVGQRFQEQKYVYPEWAKIYSGRHPVPDRAESNVSQLDGTTEGRQAHPSGTRMVAERNDM